MWNNQLRGKSVYFPLLPSQMPLLPKDTQSTGLKACWRRYGLFSRASLLVFSPIFNLCSKDTSAATAKTVREIKQTQHGAA
jgi:hypothetical protein